MSVWAEALRIGVFYTIVPALLGSLLHELTHAVVVVLTGQRLQGMDLHRLVSTRRAVVRYEYSGQPATKYLIGFAPTGLGIVAAATYLLAFGIPSGPAGMALAIGWAFYTLQLSREDVTGRAYPDDREGKAIEGIFIALVGMAILLVEYEPAQFMGWALFGAGVFLAAWNMALHIRAEQTADQSGV